MTAPTATEWFDQFDLEDVRERAPWWCARHWAPCPLMHANGISMTIKMTEIFVNEYAGDLIEPDELNAKVAEMAPFCCHLGDEKMFQLWGECGPQA